MNQTCDFLVYASNNILLTECDQKREAVISDYKDFIITECLKEQELNSLWSSNKLFVQRETEKCSYKDQLCSLDTETKHPHFSLQQVVFINV